MMADSNARLLEFGGTVAKEYDPVIQQLLAELNLAKLDGRGKSHPVQISPRSVRWVLEWQTDQVSYKMHIAVRIVDLNNQNSIDNIMVQKEASTPYDFEGHTPTTIMKVIKTMNVDEIRKAILGFWPK